MGKFSDEEVIKFLVDLAFEAQDDLRRQGVEDILTVEEMEKVVMELYERMKRDKAFAEEVYREMGKRRESG